MTETQLDLPDEKKDRLAFSMRETANLLGLDYQSVYRLCKRGLLRSSGCMRTKLFARSEIERFLRDTMK